MKQILKIILPISIAILIILGLAFYWFQWRPSVIRKSCYFQNMFTGERFEMNYNNCLLSNGLEK